MKFKAITMSLLALVMFGSCSDDDKSADNCEAENIGYLKLTIPNSTNRTAVLFTEVGNSSNSYEEFISSNKASATLEVDPGTYTVVVDQVNANGEALTESFQFNATFEQCETVTKTVVFSN